MDKYQNTLDHDFWNDRWENNQTGWDLGQPNPAIAKYMEQYTDKHARILIPGCGNSYEAEYLVELGFTDITIMDIAETASRILDKKFESVSQIKVVCGDFFKHKAVYDLILEHTFFCAITPKYREEYHEKCCELLDVSGKLVGVLFDREFESGPPFGGSKQEYESLFGKHFHLSVMEKSKHSVPPRAGHELFFIAVKK